MNIYFYVNVTGCSVKKQFSIGEKNSIVICRIPTLILLLFMQWFCFLIHLISYITMSNQKKIILYSALIFHTLFGYSILIFNIIILIFLLHLEIIIIFHRPYYMMIRYYKRWLITFSRGEKSLWCYSHSNLTPNDARLSRDSYLD